MSDQNIKAVADEELGGVAGGYLQVSKWRDFATTSVFWPMNNAVINASDNDRQIVSTINNVLQGTMVPGADVAAPVYRIWSEYNSIYRPRLQSETVKATLDQALYAAVQYINQNA